MCHPIIVETVKRQMLSRRDLLRSAPAAAAAAVVVSAAPASLANTPRRVVDMTHTLTPDFPTYFGTSGYSKKQLFNFKDNGFNLFELAINEHTGTHIDAPLHFSEKTSIDEVPVGDLVVPLAVVDIRAKADANPDAQVTPDDLTAWIAANGPFPERCCVAALSGWQAHLGTPKFRGQDAAGSLHFPGFHVEAAAMLLERTTAVGVAVDTLSIDYGPSKDFVTHYKWLPAGRWAVENVANLASVPAVGATLVVGSPKHQGGSGGPARLIALA